MKVLAQTPHSPTAPIDFPIHPEYQVTDNNAGLGKFISALFANAAVIFGLLLLVYLIYGSFRLLTSGGNDKAVSDAQKIITNAIIGFVILAAVYLLMMVVSLVLGVDLLNLRFTGPVP